MAVGWTGTGETDNEEFTWNGANELCRGLAFGELRDWRLPSLDEIYRFAQTMYEYSKAYRDAGGIRLNDWYWTSQDDGYFHIDSAIPSHQVEPFSQQSRYKTRVICVRDSRPAN